MVGIRGVVEHDDQPASGQLRAPQRATIHRRGRDALIGNSQLAQENFQRRVGRHRLQIGRMRLEIDEQLAVGEALRHSMRHVHRQRGLADTRHAVDGADRYRGVVEGAMRRSSSVLRPAKSGMS